MQFLYESTVKDLAGRVARQFGGRRERFPQGLTSLGAFYRVRTTVSTMRLHFHLGDVRQTIWVRNFQIADRFPKLAVSFNQPFPSHALVRMTDLGTLVPCYINDFVYCDASLARRFVEENSDSIKHMKLVGEDCLCVLTGHISLSLMTNELDRLTTSIALLEQIFHRYCRPNHSES